MSSQNKLSLHLATFIQGNLELRLDEYSREKLAQAKKGLNHSASTLLEKNKDASPAMGSKSRNSGNPLSKLSTIVQLKKGMTGIEGKKKKKRQQSLVFKTMGEKSLKLPQLHPQPSILQMRIEEFSSKKEKKPKRHMSNKVSIDSIMDAPSIRITGVDNVTTDINQPPKEIVSEKKKKKAKKFNFVPIKETSLPALSEPILQKQVTTPKLTLIPSNDKVSSTFLGNKQGNLLRDKLARHFQDQIKIEQLDDIQPIHRERITSEKQTVQHENSRYDEKLENAGLDEVGAPTPPPEFKDNLRRSDHITCQTLSNAGIVITKEMMESGLSPDLNSTGEGALDQYSPIPVSNQQDQPVSNNDIQILYLMEEGIKDRVIKQIDDQRSTLQLIEESNQTKEEENSIEEIENKKLIVPSKEQIKESLSLSPQRKKRHLSTIDQYLTPSQQKKIKKIKERRIKEKLLELEEKAKQHKIHTHLKSLNLEGDILLPAALTTNYKHAPVLLSRNQQPFMRMAGSLGATQSQLNLTTTYKFHQNKLLGPSPSKTSMESNGGQKEQNQQMFNMSYLQKSFVNNKSRLDVSAQKIDASFVTSQHSTMLPPMPSKYIQPAVQYSSAKQLSVPLQAIYSKFARKINEFKESKLPPILAGVPISEVLEKAKLQKNQLRKSIIKKDNSTKKRDSSVEASPQAEMLSIRIEPSARIKKLEEMAEQIPPYSKIGLTPEEVPQECVTPKRLSDIIKRESIRQSLNGSKWAPSPQLQIIRESGENTSTSPMGSKSPGSSQIELKVVVPQIILVEQQEVAQNVQIIDACDEPSVIQKDDQSLFGTATEQGLFMVRTNTQGDGGGHEERFSMVNTDRDFTQRVLQSKKTSSRVVTAIRVPQSGLFLPPPQNLSDREGFQKMQQDLALTPFKSQGESEQPDQTLTLALPSKFRKPISEQQEQQPVEENTNIDDQLATMIELLKNMDTDKKKQIIKELGSRLAGGNQANGTANIIIASS
ncbi:hypothetical protein FGO68_gene12255 [Halteria grandinella]|uniref:Uncharacterized protein n=1 Tax=Halteria grandinella TaxID=5974 RepID=A0A8J8P060_HALGN|nr:hypothetical protein FGO68_gene12255 [Halteria grandinella]